MCPRQQDLQSCCHTVVVQGSRFPCHLESEHSRLTSFELISGSAMRKRSDNLNLRFLPYLFQSTDIVRLISSLSFTTLQLPFSKGPNLRDMYGT